MFRSLLLPLSLLLCASAHAQEHALPASTTARIDSMFARFDHDGTPGYAVGVVEDGRLVFAKGYGRANLDDNISITPATAFHLASLSKQFTAAAVALLILDHKLTLETPVDQFFPQIAKFHADLRIKHLIYFTSGLPEYTSLPRANGDPWYSAYYFTIDDAIATTLSAKSLSFAPGSRWEYSNVDYMLLAKIVAKVSGMSLAEFLHERLFAPLGMRQSELNDDATEIIPHRATGYADRGEAKIRAELAKGGSIHLEPERFLNSCRRAPNIERSAARRAADCGRHVW
jgi:CubicO group peptidase (beta-lactamase class C family)